MLSAKFAAFHLSGFSRRCVDPFGSQVRVVQHKQTRDLYALKYINKTKCVKMKAVANIVQERRLLEEVCSMHPLIVFQPVLTAPP